MQNLIPTVSIIKHCWKCEKWYSWWWLEVLIWNKNSFSCKNIAYKVDKIVSISFQKIK